MEGKEEGNNGREVWGSFKGFSPIGKSFEISLFPHSQTPSLFRAEHLWQAPQLDVFPFCNSRGTPHLPSRSLGPSRWPSYLYLLGQRPLQRPWWVSLGRAASPGGESGWKTELGSFPA